MKGRKILKYAYVRARRPPRWQSAGRSFGASRFFVVFLIVFIRVHLWLNMFFFGPCKDRNWPRMDTDERGWNECLAYRAQVGFPLQVVHPQGCQAIHYRAPTAHRVSKTIFNVQFVPECAIHGF